MEIKIALAGNPNCGKTTVFNALTGDRRYVGNWAGVTVDKGEGQLKGRKDVTVIDLPGVYSLSPYTSEEVITRDYVVSKEPHVILNVADASNIERSLYLTTQLMETGLPILLMLNMTDLAEKKGVVTDCGKLSRLLGVEVAETSAVKGQGVAETAEKAALLAGKAAGYVTSFYSAETEKSLKTIENLIKSTVPERLIRWYAVKLFERDKAVTTELDLTKGAAQQIETAISQREKRSGDSSDSILISERYDYVERIIRQCVIKTDSALTPTQKADRILTGKFTALPIFLLIMTLVYFLSVGPAGAFLSAFFKDVVIGQWMTQPLQAFLQSASCADWLQSLILDGIMGGVGSVLGFLPQLALLFLMLSLLEDCGYMSRVAFIMDRFFRFFGLSGKSFIPMLIATGCGVPAIMASRTVEDAPRRRMTIITATFMPCGAKLPVIALVSTVFFGGAWWIAPICYIAGAASVLLSGLILKKTKLFAGDETPFVMELPDYHLPQPTRLLSTVWERCWSFIRRAGSVILLASAALWFLSSFGWLNGSLHMVIDPADSILRFIGEKIAAVFAPLGFGSWQAAVASVMGLLAKEELVGAFGVLGSAESVLGSGLAAFSFLMFNLLCAPCFAAISAIAKEMNDPFWTGFALCYQTAFAYAVSLCIYQLGSFAVTGSFTALTMFALLALAGALFLVVRPAAKYKKNAKILLTKTRKRV